MFQESTFSWMVLYLLRIYGSEKPLSPSRWLRQQWRKKSNECADTSTPKWQRT